MCRQSCGLTKWMAGKIAQEIVLLIIFYGLVTKKILKRKFALNMFISLAEVAIRKVRLIRMSIS